MHMLQAEDVCSMLPSLQTAVNTKEAHIFSVRPMNTSSFCWCLKAVSRTSPARCRRWEQLLSTAEHCTLSSCGQRKKGALLLDEAHAHEQLLLVLEEAALRHDQVAVVCIFLSQILRQHWHLRTRKGADALAMIDTRGSVHHDQVAVVCVLLSQILRQHWHLRTCSRADAAVETHLARCHNTCLPTHDVLGRHACHAAG